MPIAHSFLITPIVVAALILYLCLLRSHLCAPLQCTAGQPAHLQQRHAAHFRLWLRTSLRPQSADAIYTPKKGSFVIFVIIIVNNVVGANDYSPFSHLVSVG
jgi:hypothetical protein